MTILSPTKDAIIRLLDGTKTLKEIAEIVKTKEGYVYKIVTLTGLPYIQKQTKRQRILELAKTGEFTIEEIAKMVGQLKGEITKVFRECGINYNKKGKTNETR